jgi:RecA/RadA recombinase
MSPVDPARREEFLEYIVKEHADEAETIIYRMHGPQIRIPFISPMLTWATSGGMPMGHFGRWYGPEGSGKSLTNWGLIFGAQNFAEIISQWFEVDIKFFERRNLALAARKVKQEMKKAIERFPDGMEAIIFDTEQRVDLDFAERMGVNVKRLEVVNNNVTEEIIKDATKALAAFHIVIIDSATNAQSVAEAGLEPGAYEQGTGAKAWSRLKQFRRVMDRHENVLIIVDQMRSTGLGSGKMYRGPDAAPPNVRFLRHNASVAIEYDAGKKLYLDRNMQLTDDYDKASPDIRSLGTNGKEPHGLEMRCKVMKNSTGKPFRNARVRFTFPVADHRTGELLQDVGFDTAFELVEIASHFDVIEYDGNGRYYPLDDDFQRLPKDKGKGNVSWHGANNCREAIVADEALQERIFSRLRRDM